MKDANCPYQCNGAHEIFMSAFGKCVPCPHCQSITSQAEAMEEEYVVDEEGEVVGVQDQYSHLYIPKQYSDALPVDEEIFPTTALGAFSQESIHELITLMRNINKATYKGDIYELSVYMYAPNLVDMKLFVYGVQRFAIENGLKVTPYISANTLNGIQRVGEFSLTQIENVKDLTGELEGVHPDLLNAVDGLRVIQETDLTYHDFITADICFIDATANTTEKGWTAIADILGERAKKGKPTYVTGYWSTKNAQYAGMKGLRYLTLPSGVVPRLDLLVPVEMKGKKKGSVEFKGTDTILQNTSTSHTNASSGMTMDRFKNMSNTGNNGNQY